VTDTKSGSSPRRSTSALFRFSAPTGVFGGKNSNENSGPSRRARIAEILGIAPTIASQTDPRPLADVVRSSTP
jgi:hypothetical protein